MITCREFDDFIMAYLEAELPAPVREVFETHISECPECGDYLASYRETVKLGKSVCAAPDSPLPEDVPEPLVRAILAACAARQT